MAKKDSAPDVASSPPPMIDEGNGERPRKPYGLKPLCRVTRYGVTTYHPHHKNTERRNRAGKDELLDYFVCHDCTATWKLPVSKRDDPSEYQQEHTEVKA